VSTAATGFAAGSTHWVRVTRSALTGDVKFYTSDNFSPGAGTGSWTQLGTTLATTAGAIHDGTSILQVGNRASNDLPFKGRIYYADVHNGIYDAVAAKFNPSIDAGPSSVGSFTSSTGEAWTLAGSAAIDPSGSAQNQIDTVAYDAAGRQVFHIDGVGAITQNFYDANGSVIRTLAYATALSPAQVASLGPNPSTATVQSL
jgi:hypothetical protein